MDSNIKKSGNVRASKLPGRSVESQTVNISSGGRGNLGNLGNLGRGNLGSGRGSLGSLGRGTRLVVSEDKDKKQPSKITIPIGKKEKKSEEEEGIIIDFINKGDKGDKSVSGQNIVSDPSAYFRKFKQINTNKVSAFYSDNVKNKPLSAKDRTDASKAKIERENNLQPLIFKYSGLSIYSYEKMQKLKSYDVVSSGSDGPGTVNDPRGGTVSTIIKCSECGQIDCPGHFGLINFPDTPIINPIAVDIVINILSVVCNDCGNILVTKDFLKDKGILDLRFEKRLARMKNECKNIRCVSSNKKCVGNKPTTQCGDRRTFDTTYAKKTGNLRYKLGRSDKLYYLPITDNISSLDKNKHSVNPNRPNDNVMAIFKIIEMSKETMEILGFTGDVKPSDLILKGLLVISILARPPRYISGSLKMDPLTDAYIKIAGKAIRLKTEKASVDSGSSNTAVRTEDLYTSIKELIFKSDEKKKTNQSFKSIFELIQGKESLMRGVLMGKRGNFSGRTVAGPDPTLKFGQIGFPNAWVNQLTKPIHVVAHNKEYLTKLLREGKITHITRKNEGMRRLCTKACQEKLNINIGDKLERWMQDGDLFINNRQPTLHRQSMMGYEIVLGDPYTIRLHLSVTTPMNCDFDGDENNAWDPQDYEVEAEVDILFNVKNNLMSAEQNRPIMGLVMNSITAMYLLTKPDVYNPTTKALIDGVRIDDDLFDELLKMISEPNDIDSLAYRLHKYGVHPRSGKAIVSALFPKDFCYKLKGIVIREGILISGRLTKGHVGPSDRSIIQELYKNYGSDVVVKFLTEAPWICNKWLLETGFSMGLIDIINIGIDPVTGQEFDKSDQILKEQLAKVYVQLESLGGEIKDNPTEESFRQKQINNLVSIADGIGVELTNRVLRKDNPLTVMTDKGAGTKGGVANLGQAIGAVGQQFYRGERLKPTITGNTRLLPFFDENETSAVANGFIPVSFFKGLSPEELFFLQAGGREGLLDTALKTSETGLLQRNLTKAFENIIVSYDGSIRNTIGTLFHPLYNAGYDIGEMVSVNKPGVEKFSSFCDIQSMVESLNTKRGWIPKTENTNIIKNRNMLDNNFEDNILPQNVFDNHPEIYNTKPFVVPKNLPKEIPKSKRHTSKYELARIIGTRATQLSRNAPILVKDVDQEFNFVKIAKKEYYAGELGFLEIVREHPNGEIEIVPAIPPELLEQ